jgi:hypothetical protein
MHSAHRAATGIALATSALVAVAGRPLASDDAATTPAGQCQLESWSERQPGSRAVVVAPACGLVDGLELGADMTVLDPATPMRGGAGLALKWVPPSWQAATQWGDLRWGLKLSASLDHPASGGWRGAGGGLLGVATLTPAADWAVHANLGTSHVNGVGSATLLNLALAWAPQPEWSVFVETQANDRRAWLGGSVNTVGGRWWLQPERLGIDLTASREVGSASTLWTLGFGWTGLSF